MKPLEAELALCYLRQARGSIARLAQITSYERATSGDYESKLDDALASLSNLERQICKAARPTR